MEIKSPEQGKRPRAPVEFVTLGAAHAKVVGFTGARGRWPCYGELVAIFGTLTFIIAPEVYTPVVEST